MRGEGEAERDEHGESGGWMEDEGEVELRRPSEEAAATCSAGGLGRCMESLGELGCSMCGKRDVNCATGGGEADEARL